MHQEFLVASRRWCFHLKTISPIEKGGLNLGERSNFYGIWKWELGVFISLEGIIGRAKDANQSYLMIIEFPSISSKINFISCALMSDMIPSAEVTLDTLGAMKIDDQTLMVTVFIIITHQLLSKDGRISRSSQVNVVSFKRLVFKPSQCFQLARSNILNVFSSQRFALRPSQRFQLAALRAQT